jgi:L-fuculose-phosphate aldolase
MQPPQRQFRRQITEIVEVCHACAERQYTTSHGGNLSWRVGPDDVLITPTRVNKGKIAFDDICIVGMDKSVHYAAPGRQPTGEVYIHLGILSKRPDIASVIHAHPAWLTAFALSKPELLAKPWLPEPIIEVGPLAVTDYAQPLTEELARTFDPVILRHNAFLMRNHGVVLLCTEGIQRCLELLEMTETTAKSVALAEMMGGTRPLNREQVRGLDETMRTRGVRLPGAPGQVRSLADLF